MKDHRRVDATLDIDTHPVYYVGIRKLDTDRCQNDQLSRVKYGRSLMNTSFVHAAFPYGQKRSTFLFSLGNCIHTAPSVSNFSIHPYITFINYSIHNYQYFESVSITRFVLTIYVINQSQSLGFLNEKKMEPHY